MLKFHVQEWERCIKYIFPACSKVAGRHMSDLCNLRCERYVDLKCMALAVHAPAQLFTLSVCLLAVPLQTASESGSHASVPESHAKFSLPFPMLATFACCRQHCLIPLLGVMRMRYCARQLHDSHGLRHAYSRLRHT